MKKKWNQAHKIYLYSEKYMNPGPEILCKQDLEYTNILCKVKSQFTKFLCKYNHEYNIILCKPDLE